MSLLNPLTGKCVGRNPLTGKFAKKCQELDSSIIESPNKSSSSCTEASRKTEVQVAETGTGGSLTPPTISETRSKENACASEVSTPEQSWKVGRRIVELHHMAKQMYCTDCDKPLHLSNIVHERRDGFGSVLMIECECGIVRDVTTGKTHRVRNHGPPIFDVNTKAALGNWSPKSNEDSCQVRNIVCRRKFFMIDVVSPQDFVAFHERYTNPSYVLKPNVSLYCLTSEDVYFVETNELIDVFDPETNPFQYIGQFKHATKLIRMPLATFYQLADDIGDPTVKVCFMTNTGRCGSTLLATSLGKIPGTLLHAEPDCLTNIGHIWKGKSVTLSEYEHLLVATIRVLCKPHRDVERVCIKTRSCATCHVDAIFKHFPKFSIIFGYRNSLATVSSFLGLMLSETAPSLAMYLIVSDSFSRYVPWFRRKLFYDFCYMLEENVYTGKADKMNTVEQFTYAWANCIRVIREFQRQGGILTPILYEDMVADKVAQLHKVFDELDIDKKHIGFALKAFSDDSQVGSPLSRENIQNLTRRQVSKENIIKANKILLKFELQNIGEVFKLPENSE